MLQAEIVLGKLVKGIEWIRLESLVMSQVEGYCSLPIQSNFTNHNFNFNSHFLISMHDASLANSLASNMPMAHIYGYFAEGTKDNNGDGRTFSWTLEVVGLIHIP